MARPPTVVNVRRDPYDVYIGRPSKWGNPFKIGKDGGRQLVISKYRAWILHKFPDPTELGLALLELEGKRLGCYCKPAACHGDVLVALFKEHCT